MTDNYLFFVGTMGSGGAERVISLLSKKLIQSVAKNVKIITYYDCVSFYELDAGVNVFSLEKETGSKNLFKNLICLRKHFKQHDGVILSFLAPFNILAILAHMGVRNPIIVADRNDPNKIPQNRIIRKIRDFLYRFADAVVVQTEHNQRYFSKKVQKKSTVIYNPVALSAMAGIALKTPPKHQIITVARLMPQKNHRLLIDAFSQIAEEYPEYEVICYGEGPERARLEQYITSKNLKNRIHMPGEVTDVPMRISEAELFVLPSDYEGMPNALIEAMCVGLPVISTKVSGATDLIEDGVNGLLIDIGDVKGLANAMRTLLCDREMQLRFAQKAIEINTALHVEKIMEQWVDLISNLS